MSTFVSYYKRLNPFQYFIIVPILYKPQSHYIPHENYSLMGIPF